jgi:hypothetical protein
MASQHLHPWWRPCRLGTLVLPSVCFTDSIQICKRRLLIGRIAYSYSPCIPFHGVATASIVSWPLIRCPTAVMNLALIPVPPMSSAVASSAVCRWKAQGIMVVIRKTGSLGGTVDGSDTRHSLSRLRTVDGSLTNHTPEVLGSRLLRLARHS